MDKLNELNTDEVQETYHTVDISNIKRADEDTGQSLTREEALSNAPLHEKGLFKVPKIIKNE